MAELESEDEALRVLEAMASKDASVPDYLWLVECRSNHRSLFGTDASIKIRTLS